MDNQIPVIIGVAVCLILILVWISHEATQHVNARNFVNGFWEAPIVFCKNSGIKNAYLYIADDRVYFFLEDESGILLNKCVEQDLQAQWWSNIGEDTYEYLFETDEDIAPLPRDMTLRVYPDAGHMAFYKDKTIQLQLYKNYKADNGVI